MIGSNNLNGESLASALMNLKDLRRLYLGFNFVRDNGTNLICCRCHGLEEL